MGSSLFDSPSRPAHRAEPLRGEPDGYRALSGAALAAAAVAAVSPVAFFDWWLVAVPLVGVVLGGIALRDLAARQPLLTGRPLAVAALIVSLATLAGSIAAHAVEYARELPEGFSRLSYADLQPAEGEPPTAVPDTARAADGRDVLLKGFIYPGKQQHGLTQFLLVRDQGDCCFGGNPKITDRVLVQLADPAGIDFTPRLTKIAGRFRVQPVGDAALQGGVLYHLDQAHVR